MKTYTRLELDRKEPVTRLTLNRPEVRNAFDDRLIGEMLDALEEVRGAHETSGDNGPRVLVLTGAGETFCAGADMNWMRRSVRSSRDDDNPLGNRKCPTKITYTCEKDVQPSQQL